MKALILYDSMYGNTEKIAQALGSAISGEVKVSHVDKVKPDELRSFNLIIIGSPTQGFRPTKPIQEFIKSVSEDILKDINVAAFDTRITDQEVGRGLRFLMKIGGYAAPNIAKELKKKNANLIISPEGFFVKGKEGPLKEGEEKRAVNWVKEILEA